MKQILLFFLFTFSVLSLSAQNGLFISHNPYEETFQVDLTDNWAEPVAHLIVVNTSNSTMSLRWEREIIESPSEWEYRVCDKNQCFSTSTASNVVLGGQPNEPVILAPGDTTLLDLHILPRMVAGCAKVQIHLTDAANITTEFATVEYDVCVEGVSAVSDFEKANLRVYPNPTVEYISVTKNNAIKQLWISNIFGKRVKAFNTTFNGKYDISELPDGIYLVSMVDAKGSILKTVRVSKRSPRP